MNAVLFDVSVSPDGSHVYAIDTSTMKTQPNFVYVIDAQTNSVSSSVALPEANDSPIKIALTSDGGHAYVVGANSGQVWVVDTTKNTTVATIQVSSVPGIPLGRIAITPDGTRAYVTGLASTGAIYVLDTGTNHVVNIIPSFAPGGIAITRAM